MLQYSQFLATYLVWFGSTYIKIIFLKPAYKSIVLKFTTISFLWFQYLYSRLNTEPGICPAEVQKLGRIYLSTDSVIYMYIRLALLIILRRRSVGNSIPPFAGLVFCNALCCEMRMKAFRVRQFDVEVIDSERWTKFY